MSESTPVILSAEFLEQLTEYQVPASPYSEVTLSPEEVSKFVRFLMARALATNEMAQKVMRSARHLKAMHPQRWERIGKDLAKRMLRKSPQPQNVALVQQTLRRKAMGECRLPARSSSTPSNAQWPFCIPAQNLDLCQNH